MARSLSESHPTTLDDVRRRNLGRLLSLLHARGPLSRSEIASEMGINRSTVGVLVSELADATVVWETAGVGRGVGRPSLVVKPVAESAAVLAFDVRVERTVVALVGVGGEILAREERRTRARDPRSVVGQMCALAGDVLAGAPDGCTHVGTGVALPGLIRHSDGHVVLAPNLGWSDVAFGELLTEGLASTAAGAPPVVIGNDADLGALAEHARGAAVGYDNAVYLSGEVGIGGGLIIDGRLVTGSGGLGGEVGHMVVNPKGHRCRCGATGCWETEIGRAAVLRALGIDDSLGELPEISRTRTVRRVADWIGLGLANLVNIFNPDIVILGGHLRRIHEVAGADIEVRLSQALPSSRDLVTLTYPSFGPSSALVGAAELAFEPLLSDPLGWLASLSRAS